jgi:DNA repair protein RadC
MTPEEKQSAAVKAAATEATLDAVKEINKAAKEAGDPLKKEIAEAEVEKDVEEKAKQAFVAAQEEHEAKSKDAIKALVEEETKELEAMSQTAKNIASMSALHLRETAESFAKNQARNYVVQHADPQIAGAVATSKETEAIRQQATDSCEAWIAVFASSVACCLTASVSLDVATAPAICGSAC